VFGHVVRGTNVLTTFNQFQYWTGTQTKNLVYNLGSPFDTLPLLYPSLIDSNLVFLDITLLQLSVKPSSGGAHLLSWNSPAGMTNIVEFTTNLPPVWKTLVQTNGTGAQISVVDPGVADKSRLYRVRVAY
jgi:hypothetical protein